MSVITFNGMLQYDPTLFDDIVLPLGLDKDVMVRTINQKSGQLLCYYDVPTHFKQLITDWFNVIYYPNMVKMLEALNLDYKVLQPYYREDKVTDTESHNNKNVVDGTVEVDSNTKGNVSAYDSNLYSPNQENVVDGTQETDVTTTDSGSRNYKHDYTSKGNLGNFSNQELVTKELNLRLTYNIYDAVAKAFEKEFLVQVY